MCKDDRQSNTTHQVADGSELKLLPYTTLITVARHTEKRQTAETENTSRSSSSKQCKTIDDLSVEIAGQIFLHVQSPSILDICIIQLVTFAFSIKRGNRERERERGINDDSSSDYIVLTPL